MGVILLVVALPSANRLNNPMWIFILFLSQVWAQGMDGFLMPPKNQLSASARSALENYQVQGQIAAIKSEEQTLVFGLRYAMLDARPIDKDLYIEDAIFVYTKNLEGQRKIGTRLMIGSQSDKPFANSNVLAIFASVFYLYPISEKAQWMLSMNYSNVISLWNNIPFPGANYFYRSPEWVILAGFPINSATRIYPSGYSWTAAALGLYSMKFEFAYGPPFFQYFTSLEWGQQAFLLKDREVKKERLFYDEKRASIGVRMPLAKQLKMDLRGGYAFDRSFFTAESYKDKRASNTFEIEDSWYGSINLTQEF